MLQRHKHIKTMSLLTVEMSMISHLIVRCRCKRSITPPATCWRSASSARSAEPSPWVYHHLITLDIRPADHHDNAQQEGGSYEVHVSLGATLHWVRSLGYLSPEEAFKNGEPLPPRGVPLDTEVAGFSTKIEQAVPDAGVQPGAVYHNITAIRHAAVMSKTKVRVGEAPMRLDAHLPVWLKRP